MSRSQRDTAPMGAPAFGYYGGYMPSVGPSEDWQAVRAGGPEHLMDTVQEGGRPRKRPACGLWGTEGYRQVDRATVRCKTCERVQRERGKK